jgi:hypothetical protein
VELSLATVLVPYLSIYRHLSRHSEAPESLDTYTAREHYFGGGFDVAPETPIGSPAHTLFAPRKVMLAGRSRPPMARSPLRRVGVAEPIKPSRVALTPLILVAKAPLDATPVLGVGLQTNIHSASGIHIVTIVCHKKGNAETAKASRGLGESP